MFALGARIGASSANETEITNELNSARWPPIFITNRTHNSRSPTVSLLHSDPRQVVYKYACSSVQQTEIKLAGNALKLGR